MAEKIVIGVQMPNAVSSRALVCLALFALLTLAPETTALADGWIEELKVGVLAHDVPDLWSGFRAESNSAALNFEALLSPSVVFLGGAIRPVVGASVNTEGGTSNIYVDARWQYETPSGIFFGLGLGGTVHDGQLELKDFDRKALGSRVLFHIPLEIGYRLDAHNSISAYFEHMSNAYTVDPNEGLDRIGLRYGYRF
ncbi:acyloxyacyl hydrolase [Hyphomicrobium sp.]|uniref:acyloxyacyl hydrolase n=1 Tax=Hyphomicrobium sp. TaxID=82 RepID=UPI002E35A30B|nr:acyloxyacyl hydrolase [Hyphomicrobium sp.]HEX2840025.1 acyloxyacyl hydrolase [Hyphomicrobium sp.]